MYTCLLCLGFDERFCGGDQSETQSVASMAIKGPPSRITWQFQLSMHDRRSAITCATLVVPSC